MLRKAASRRGWPSGRGTRLLQPGNASVWRGNPGTTADGACGARGSCYLERGWRGLEGTTSLRTGVRGAQCRSTVSEWEKTGGRRAGGPGDLKGLRLASCQIVSCQDLETCSREERPAWEGVDENNLGIPANAECAQMM